MLILDVEISPRVKVLQGYRDLDLSIVREHASCLVADLGAERLELLVQLSVVDVSSSRGLAVSGTKLRRWR